MASKRSISELKLKDVIYLIDKSLKNQSPDFKYYKSIKLFLIELQKRNPNEFVMLTHGECEEDGAVYAPSDGEKVLLDKARPFREGESTEGWVQVTRP